MTDHTERFKNGLFVVVSVLAIIVCMLAVAGIVVVLANYWSVGKYVFSVAGAILLIYLIGWWVELSA